MSLRNIKKRAKGKKLLCAGIGTGPQTATGVVGPHPGESIFINVTQTF